MFNDFETYFYESVIVPYYEYIGRKNDSRYGRSLDLKLALISASSLFHLREHLPSGHEISRRKFEKICPEYALIADVVNVSKHKTISRNNPQLSNASQIFERITITMYEDELGEYSFSDKAILLTLNDGNDVFLHGLLYIVLQAWNEFLFSEGVISKTYNIEQPIEVPFHTREECSGLDLSLVSGFLFKVSMQLLKYDQKLGKAFPVDLSDAKMEMNVYKPQEIELTAINESTGISASTIVILTVEDTKALCKLKTEDETQNFISELRYVQDEYEKLCLSLK